MNDAHSRSLWCSDLHSIAKGYKHSIMSEVVNNENAIATKKRVGSYQQPFVEKYRPKVLEDVEGNEETILRLRAIGKDGNMPNLILAGPPGTGSKYMDAYALLYVRII
jgi:hypothetical protein